MNGENNCAHTAMPYQDSECIRSSDSAVLPWGRSSLQRRVVTGGRPVGGVRARGECTDQREKGDRSMPSCG